MPVILHKRELLYQINFSHDADLSPADRDKVVMPLGELHICKAFFPSQKRRKKQTFRSSNSVLHLLLSRKFSRQTSLLVALWLCSLNELAVRSFCCFELK